jgi:hypothetical protein
MIYILGRQKDLSTIKIIDWLIYYNIEFKRINSPFDIILLRKSCGLYSLIGSKKKLKKKTL